MWTGDVAEPLRPVLAEANLLVAKCNLRERIAEKHVPNTRSSRGGDLRVGEGPRVSRRPGHGSAQVALNP